MLLAICLFGLVCSPGPQSWPQSVLSDHAIAARRLAVITDARKLASKPGTPSSVIAFSGQAPQYSAAQAEADRKWFARMQQVKSDAVGLIRMNKLEPAGRMLEAYLTEDPAAVEIATLLADVHLRMERPKEATDDLAPFFKPGAMDRVQERMSLALSMQGKEFEGQRAYCERQIMSFAQTWEASKSQFLPDARSPKGLKILSDLAIGLDATSECDFDTGRFYLSAALSDDPHNPLASIVLADSLALARKYKEAIELLKAARPRASGPLANSIDYDLSNYAYLQDKQGNKG